MKHLIIYLISMGLIVPSMAFATDIRSTGCKLNFWSCRKGKRKVQDRYTDWTELKGSKKYKYNKDLNSEQVQSIFHTLKYDSSNRERSHALDTLRYSTVDDSQVMRTLSEEVLPYETDEYHVRDMIKLLGSRQPKDHIIHERLAYMATNKKLDYYVRRDALNALERIQQTHNPNSLKPEDNFNGYVIRKLVKYLADNPDERNVAKILDNVGTAQFDAMVGEMHLVGWELFCKYRSWESCNLAPSAFPKTKQADARKDAEKVTPAPYDHFSNPYKGNEDDLFSARLKRRYGSSQ